MMAVRIALMLAAVACWLGAVVTVIALAGRRSTRSLVSLMFNGMAWFDPATFTPEAAPLVQRLRLLFAGFVGCVILTALSMMV